MEIRKGIRTKKGKGNYEGRKQNGRNKHERKQVRKGKW
jgi:hypothetical protein